MTIRDITKPVVLDVEYAGQAKTPWGTFSDGFNAQTKINRKDWDPNWNVALEMGGWLVGDTITIIGVQGTPTFFINGVLHTASWGQDSLAATLQRAIAQSRT